MTTEALLERSVELGRYCKNAAEVHQFNNWIEEKGHLNYDGHDRWILNGTKKVLSTKKLYLEFLLSTITYPTYIKRPFAILGILDSDSVYDITNTKDGFQSIHVGSIEQCKETIALYHQVGDAATEYDFFHEYDKVYEAIRLTPKMKELATSY